MDIVFVSIGHGDIGVLSRSSSFIESTLVFDRGIASDGVGGAIAEIVAVRLCSSFPCCRSPSDWFVRNARVVLWRPRMYALARSSRIA